MKVTPRIEKTGYGDMATASAAGKVFYGGRPDSERDLNELKTQVLRSFPDSQFAWFKAPRIGREAYVDMAVDDRRTNPRGVMVNPMGRAFRPVLLTSGSKLRLAESPNELESWMSRGWKEGSSKLHAKLDRLKSVDGNGWASLVDGEFSARDVDSALSELSRDSNYDQLPV